MPWRLLPPGLLAFDLAIAFERVADGAIAIGHPRARRVHPVHHHVALAALSYGQLSAGPPLDAVAWELRAADVGDFGRASWPHRSLPLGPIVAQWRVRSAKCGQEPGESALGGQSSELWRQQDGGAMCQHAWLRSRKPEHRKFLVAR